MLIAVPFQEESLTFEVPDDRVAGVWEGPPAVPAGEVARRIGEALERPREFPALRQAVVPGDRVIIPIDPTVPEAGAILAAMAGVLASAGVEPGNVTVVPSGPLPTGVVPEGMTAIAHDPDDRTEIAYLAATTGGRRVYLNRNLTDADLVIPVGRLGFDPVLGHGGPWGVIYPGLSDAETLRAFRALAAADRDPEAGNLAFAESTEVSWLLGCQFHVGVVPAASGGLAEVVAGLEGAVRSAGIAAADAAWTFRPAGRAELVVAGVGGPGRAATLDDLAGALTAAERLVRHGGKIVVLSRVAGPLGPSFQRLLGADGGRPGPATLRGSEGEADYPAALQVARALARADVYLLSALPEQEVEDLGMVPLGRPEEARRLVALSPSTLFLAHADRTRTVAADEEG